MISWYKFAKLIIKLYITVSGDGIRVTGEENIPIGPKIIVANHPNATDGFMLPFVFPEILHFLIQGSVFSTPLIGRLLTWAEQIPVEKGNGSQALALAKYKLEKGNSVVIFPEGRLNNGKRLHQGRSGAARLAVESGKPILPLGFFVPENVLRSFSKNIHEEQRVSTSLWQWGGDCFIRIGKPIYLVNDFQNGVNEDQLRNLTERIMFQITDLVDLAKGDSNPAYECQPAP